MRIAFIVSVLLTVLGALSGVLQLVWYMALSVPVALPYTAFMGASWTVGIVFGVAALGIFLWETH